jgi:hypothetical protein
VTTDLGEDIPPPRRRELPAYLRCPTCPYCGSPCGLGHRYHRLGWRELRCAACGQGWSGTSEQVQQARLADDAWEARGPDGEPGPRQRVVARRARRRTDQVPLFRGKP